MMKIKCCGYSPKDKYYLQALIQELVYFDPNSHSLDDCEKWELQGKKWIEEYIKARKKVV